VDGPKLESENSDRKMRRVYHFLSAHWALDDVHRKRVKISQFDELNDPFELFGARLPDDLLSGWMINHSSSGTG